MSDYGSRKAQRIEANARLHGVKMIVCGACAGSGYYDDTGSPPCASCRGTGKVRDQLNRLPSDPAPVAEDWRAKLKRETKLRSLKKRLREPA